MLFVLDNYDSFTYNLVQYLGELGADMDVERNDALGVADVLARRPRGILISPGPGSPGEAGTILPGCPASRRGAAVGGAGCAGPAGARIRLC